MDKINKYKSKTPNRKRDQKHKKIVTLLLKETGFL